MTLNRGLITQQSTISHYRVPFYNALERLRPQPWYFEVVFDMAELLNPTFFEEKLDPKDMLFPIHQGNTIRIPLFGNSTIYQTFFWEARKYDLIISENAVHNLSYPLTHLHQFTGKKIMYWGHGKDRKILNISYFKAISEHIKLSLVRRSDGFFDYTQGVADYLVSKEVLADKIFVLNNTIDTRLQRSAYQSSLPYRSEFRRKLNLENKKILLFVGRFSENKRIDFLLNSFELLNQFDNQYHFITG